jgi:hypothetical protein
MPREFWILRYGALVLFPGVTGYELQVFEVWSADSQVAMPQSGVRFQ